MRQQVILDTGAIVALINRQDQQHQWVVRELATIQPPLIICEAVISEAFFLLRRVRNGIETLKDLLTQVAS
ncbi:PIN domain-containing protein [Leptolyngbya sp. AN03gr2]|uniref:PIN domain-containing protein n=1 Tax=unclassified Leptolyngbya TaxID=2650499 RepID=UPI003D31EA4E